MMIIRIIHSKRFITPVTFTYSYTDGRGVVQCLAQGHLDMQLGEPGVQTSDNCFQLLDDLLYLLSYSSPDKYD